MENSKISIGITPPAKAPVGTIFFNMHTGKSSFYNGVEWIDIQSKEMEAQADGYVEARELLRFSKRLNWNEEKLKIALFYKRSAQKAKSKEKGRRRE